MAKAISTVIASILMLMIVIALSGTAYLYISGTLTGKVSTSFELVDSFNDIVTIRNSGTETITSFRSVTIDGNDALYRVSTQDSSLVGYWKFNEGNGNLAKDSSGNGKDGTISNPQWINGKFGKAIYIKQGTGAGMTLSSNVDIGNDWAIATWFEAPIEPVGDWRTLVRGVDGDHQVIVEPNSWRLGTYDNTGGTGFKPSGFNMDTLSSGWHYLVVVQTGGIGGKIEYYIDSLKIGEITGYGSITDVFWIGTCCPGGQQWGKIDDLSIYNRALTQDEIKANFNIGSQINPGGTATIKIYNQLSKGTHTLRLCTSSMCNTAYLSIQ